MLPFSEKSRLLRSMIRGVRKRVVCLVLVLKWEEGNRRWQDYHSHSNFILVWCKKLGFYNYTYVCVRAPLLTNAFFFATSRENVSCICCSMVKVTETVEHEKHEECFWNHHGCKVISPMAPLLQLEEQSAAPTTRLSTRDRLQRCLKTSMRKGAWPSFILRIWTKVKNCYENRRVYFHFSYQVSYFWSANFFSIVFWDQGTACFTRWRSCSISDKTKISVM